MIHQVQQSSQSPYYQLSRGLNLPQSDGRTPTLARNLPEDRVSLSGEGEKRAFGIKSESELSDEEKQQVSALKKRDTEVKAHEQAHMAAGGGIVQSGASYQYQSGPDGKQYAVGGEVKIDLSPEKTPEATIRKMQQARRAALAPAQPSGTDRAVAAQAAQIEAQARIERTQQAGDASNGSSDIRATGNFNTKPGDNLPPGGYRMASSVSNGHRIDLKT